MKKLLPILAFLMVTAACEDVVLLDRPAPNGGGLDCHIVCDYTDAQVTRVRADLSICRLGQGCSTCDSCKDLLEYHYTEASCEDGRGRLINIEPLDCAPNIH